MAHDHKVTFEDVLADPRLFDAMTLGEKLAALGLGIAIEDDSLTPEENAALTRAVNASTEIGRRGES